MPNYSQYNTNAQSLLDARVAEYMAWYHVAIVLYVLGAAVFIAYWFFRNGPVLWAGIGFSASGLACQAASLGVRWVYSGHVPWNDLYGSLSVVVFWTVALFLTFGARFKIWYAGPIVFVVADLLLAYVWSLGETQVPVTYGLPYAMAVQVAEAMGWTETASWKVGGAYTTTKPSKRLLSLLEPHRMTPGRWWSLVVGTS